jgi:hypothetical protein
MHFASGAIEIDLAHGPIPFDEPANLRVRTIPRRNQDRSLSGEMRNFTEMGFQGDEPSRVHDDIIIQESQDVAFCHGNCFI